MSETQNFEPADYLDGGKKKFEGKDYSGLKGLDGEKIKQIALARIAARKEEAVTIQQDSEDALHIVKMINPFEEKISKTIATPVATNEKSKTPDLSSEFFKKINEKQEGKYIVSDNAIANYKIQLSQKYPEIGTPIILDNFSVDSTGAKRYGNQLQISNPESKKYITIDTSGAIVDRGEIKDETMKSAKNPMQTFVDKLAQGIQSPNSAIIPAKEKSWENLVLSNENSKDIKTDKWSVLLLTKKDGWYNDYTGIILNGERYTFNRSLSADIGFNGAKKLVFEKGTEKITLNRPSTLIKDGITTIE